eukprot:GILI01001048.1.p1 GENE.GILI01001048.1~~GILI01001048.1.p1  ORF type:complete len:586 (-),score=164.63 GILI01001048.1:272-2029(-)
MKVLSLAFLLAGSVACLSTLTPLAQAQSATNYRRVNYCPDGALTLSHNTISLANTGHVYYADQCDVAEGALVNLFGQEAPAVPAANVNNTAPARITASFIGGNFNYNSQILVVMPPSDKIANTVPIHVYVQNNYFNTNACIRFYGSYPKNSKLVITGNHVDTATEPSTYPTMVNQIGGIIGWQSNKDFYMKENSMIQISNNNVYVMATNVAYEARGIGMWNYVYMSENCSVAINNNQVRVRGNQGKFNGGIDAFAYIAEGANTRYEMINNTINVDNGFAIGCPYARYPTTAAEEMRHSTNVVVSRNSGVINKAVYFPTSKSDGDVIFVGNSKNSLNSSIEISFNKFEVKNSDGNIRVAQTELLHSAKVKVLANTLTTVAGNPRIIFSWNMSAYDNSQVLVLHNEVRRSDAFEFYPGSFFLYYRGYNLYNNSQSHFSHNTFRAESATRKAFLLDRYPEMPFFNHSADAFRMCDNNFYNGDLDTDDKIAAALPDYVKPYVAPVSSCPAEPFPYPTMPDIPANHATFDPLSDGSSVATTSLAPTGEETLPSNDNSTFPNSAQQVAQAGSCCAVLVAAVLLNAVAVILA